ncbi:NADH-dependent flavin oxidoreductase [Alkalicoccobacillus murimartini]|uniref:2,4-dienoyl-CoA reductase-like NADH-dependent reductase (Old Yellow Enzyme family) n=1 Tax=Alkalicoccobacillus murimartini TaxID=171685 RepID=A0ABT9YIN7_9BACI|nr:NADH-dependent flavin oxidoreductase [Alkalicoccobacillus murimartini]MDQ0207727.1 2,4-dienoyl-CoA reductase-like NADH-dependent reductase (Old Yellow Enzyme family) [Alkalicoccobacillus murimartini]
MNSAYTSLFNPFTFKSGVKVDNRIMIAPMTHYSSKEDGSISEQELTFIEARSEGPGVVITACANVTANGKAFPGQPGINLDTHLPGLKKLAETIHKKGSKAVIQIHHGGVQCPPELVPNGDVLSASDIPEKGARALTDEEVKEIVKGFGEATTRAIEAGFDGVEIHGANGYLIQQFFSPHTNKRSDAWGGETAADRLAFPLAVVDAVKQAVAEKAPENFLVGYRFSPEEPETPGLTMEDTFVLVDALAAKELDYLHVSLMEAHSKARRGADETRTRLSLLHERVGELVPIVGVGSVHTPGEAVAVLEEEGMDFVALGRELLVEPNWVNLVKNGQENQIQTVIKVSEKEKYVLPEPLWNVIMNAGGWVPFEE